MSYKHDFVDDNPYLVYAPDKDTSVADVQADIEEQIDDLDDRVTTLEG